MTENVVMQPDDMLLFERTLVIGDGDIESIRQSPRAAKSSLTQNHLLTSLYSMTKAVW